MYDAVGNFDVSIAPDGRTTSFSYDGMNRQLSSTIGLGNTARQEFDAIAKLTAVIDPDGHRSDYMFNRTNVQTGERDGARQSVQTPMDAAKPGQGSA